MCPRHLDSIRGSSPRLSNDNAVLVFPVLADVDWALVVDPERLVGSGTRAPRVAGQDVVDFKHLATAGDCLGCSLLSGVLPRLLLVVVVLLSLLLVVLAILLLAIHLLVAVLLSLLLVVVLLGLLGGILRRLGLVAVLLLAEVAGRRNIRSSSYSSNRKRNRKEH